MMACTMPLLCVGEANGVPDPDLDLDLDLGLEFDYPDAHEDNAFQERDAAFAKFFDSVIIPANQQREKLDPRIRSVSA